MRRDYPLIIIVVAGLVSAALVSRWNDMHRQNLSARFAEERFYLDGPALRRVTLAFNDVAADWYWMRSLQYVGRKIVAYRDAHEGRFDLSNLSSLDLHLLPDLLEICTTLDPKFLDAYYYGALILPDLNANDAVKLLNYGIAANPDQWRLYQHLGYVYWQQDDYQKASEIYGLGAQIKGAPPWMAAISARMKAEGGATAAAREMYVHLYEASDDLNVKDMVEKQLMRLDSLDERAKIRQLLSDYAKSTGRCVASWKEIAAALRAARVRLDSSGAPTDPSNTPYRLITGGCDVDLDKNSLVPH